MEFPKRQENIAEPRIFQYNNVYQYGEGLSINGGEPSVVEVAPNTWDIRWDPNTAFNGALMYISGDYSYRSGIIFPQKIRRMLHIPIGPHLIQTPLNTANHQIEGEKPTMFMYRPNIQDLSLFISPNALDYDPSIFQRMVRQMGAINNHIQRMSTTIPELGKFAMRAHQPILEKAFKLNADQKGNNYWGHK